MSGQLKPIKVEANEYFLFGPNFERFPATEFGLAQMTKAWADAFRLHQEPSMPTDAQIESELQAKGKTAPRVTPADVEAEIASEHYFTAHDGGTGARYNEEPRITVATYTSPRALHLLTFCVLVLKNGFTVTGESACASPENFDAEIGRKIARQKAVEKIWPLLGFRLRDKTALGVNWPDKSVVPQAAPRENVLFKGRGHE